MHLIRRLPALMAATTIIVSLGSAPAAYASDESPSAEDMRGAMMQLLKLDEIFNKDPQPLQHTKVGDDATPAQPQAPQALPQTPQQPQVSVPAAPAVAQPAVAPAKPAIMVKTAGSDQPDNAKTMPSPVYPGAKGTPAKAKGSIKAAKPAQNGTPQTGTSNGTQGQENVMKGLLPDFQEDLTKPKPKSKIKRVSKPEPAVPESAE